MVWGSRGGSGSLFAHQIIFSATSLMSLDGFCRHCGEDCRLLDTSSVFLKETLISALTHSLHQGDWPPCSLQPSSLPWEGNGVIPTLLGAILHSAHSLLLAHTGLSLPQTYHTPSCLRPLHWLVPLLGTCLPRILAWLVPFHPLGLNSNVSLQASPLMALSKLGPCLWALCASPTPETLSACFISTPPGSSPDRLTQQTNSDERLPAG